MASAPVDWLTRQHIKSPSQITKADRNFRVRCHDAACELRPALVHGSGPGLRATGTMASANRLMLFRRRARALLGVLAPQEMNVHFRAIDANQFASAIDE
jgi:hypothetical protein